MSRVRSYSLFSDSIKMRSEPIACGKCGNTVSPIGSLSMSLNKMSSLNRSSGTSRGESSLELEALAAVHELSFAVESISVSEMLPRTPDLIFINVTTLEGQPYCLELTLKGWRITSNRQDCLSGDFTQIHIYTKYYDSLYALMDTISPGYRMRFADQLSQKLRNLQDFNNRAKTSCESVFSEDDELENDELPVVTPATSPIMSPRHSCAQFS